MKANFENFKLGTKVQSYDKDGYYVMSSCGTIIKYLGNGHCIIKTFDGNFYSTVQNQHKIFEVEALN